MTDRETSSHMYVLVYIFRFREDYHLRRKEFGLIDGMLRLVESRGGHTLSHGAGSKCFGPQTARSLCHLLSPADAAQATRLWVGVAGSQENFIDGCWNLNFRCQNSTLLLICPQPLKDIKPVPNFQPMREQSRLGPWSVVWSGGKAPRLWCELDSGISSLIHD